MKSLAWTCQKHLNRLIYLTDEKWESKITDQFKNLVPYFTPGFHAPLISLPFSAQQQPQFQTNIWSKRQLRAGLEMFTCFIMIVHSLCLHPGIISVTRVIHISSVHLQGPRQTRTSSVSQQTRWNQSYFFLSLWHICPYRVSNSPFYFYTPRTWASQLIFISAALLQVPHNCELHAQEATTRDTELTTKCSWLNSFWSCFSNFAFSSGDFCREFKASSSNSRLRVAVIFSPGSTIPLEERKQTKQKNTIPQILHILTPGS